MNIATAFVGGGGWSPHIRYPGWVAVSKLRSGSSTSTIETLSHFVNVPSWIVCDLFN